MRSACGPICRAIAFQTLGPRAASASRSQRRRTPSKSATCSLGRCRLAVRIERTDLGRQVLRRRRRPLLDRLVRQPAEQRPAGVVLRRRPGQAQHVAQARIVADRRRQQLADAGAVQPALERPLQRVRQALAAELARADHLEQRAQHAAVVDDAVEDLAEQGPIALRQNQQQRRRHVLHEGALAAVDRQLGQEDVVVHLVHQGEQRGQLLLGLRVEGAVEAARRGQLRQSVLRRQPVGAAPSSLRASARGSRLFRLANRPLLAMLASLLQKWTDEVVVRVFPMLYLLSYSILRCWRELHPRPSDPMYSEPAVGPESTTPDESLGRVLDSGKPESGEIRTRWLPMYSAPAVGCDFKKTDEVLVRDLRRLPLSYSANAWDCAGGIRTHGLRRIKHVLRAGSRSCFIGRATRLWSDALLYR